MDKNSLTCERPKQAITIALNANPSQDALPAGEKNIGYTEIKVAVP